MNEDLTTVALGVGKSTLIPYLYTRPSVTKILPFDVQTCTNQEEWVNLFSSTTRMKANTIDASPL